MSSSLELSTPEWRSMMSQKPRGHKEFCWNHHYRKRNPYIVSDSISYRYHSHLPYSLVVCPPKETPDNGSSPEVEFQLRNPGSSRMERIRDINWSVVRPYRAGIIVYTKIDGKLHLCMGVDAGSGDITDFGGGVRYQYDKTTLQGALREFSEESHDVFGHFDATQLCDCIALYNNAMMVIFMEIPPPSQDMRAKFLQKVTPRSELCDIVWLDLPRLQELCKGFRLSSDDGLRQRGLYTRVCELISGIETDVLVNAL